MVAVLAVTITLAIAKPIWVSQLSQPADFYGDVVRDGQSAPIGTVISAWIDGVEYSTYTTQTEGIYGPNADIDPYASFFSVQADDPDTTEKDGAENGDEVLFKINGFSTGQTTEWSSSIVRNINLSCTNCNHVPALDGLVSPSSGDTETTFTYQVTLRDVDNDAPTSVNVSIDSVDYEMSGSFSTPSTVDEYKNGKQYTFQKSNLATGSHQYKFIASDGFGKNETGLLEGPTVFTYSYILLKQGWNLISIPMEPQ